VPDPLLKHLKQSPPPALFHYTSMDVLEKMTETGQIWASEARFLNDSTEYNHARSYIKKMLRDRIAESDNDALKSQVLEDLKMADARFNEHDVYIASFSKDGDSLPQWRGYCSSGHGVAIGMNPLALKSGELEIDTKFSPRPDDEPVTDRSLLKCVYTDKEKLKVVGETLDSYLHVTEGKHPHLTPSRAGRLLINTIETCSPMFQDVSFKEEREWRLVVNCYYGDVPKRHFRIWGSTAVPFIKVDVKTNYTLDYIREVVIGPCPNEDLALLGVKRLLAARGLRRANVRKSSIPYRTW
jgi:hypothetical protein